MSYPVFYVPAGDVLPVLFSSYAGSTGASVTLTGLAVTDIEIYKDGSTTQRASDAGYTLLDTDGIDFDSITGIHGFSIDTGDNTDAGFYTVGAWFTVVVSSVTVDSQTVSFIACQFRLMPAESVAGKPKVDVDAWLGTAAATPTVAGVPEVDITHFNGTAGTFASGRPEVNATHFAGTAYATALAAEVDAVWDEVLTAAAHNVVNSAARRLRTLQDNGLYALASVWVDETSGTSTGTTSYEDATITNRSNDLDNAVTVAGNVGITSVQITNGNSITLTAGLEGYNVWGNGSTIALGGQNVGGTIFREFGAVSGTGTSTGSPIFFEDCFVGNVTLAPAVMQRVGLNGTVTVGSAGDFIFTDCYSRVAGASSPVLDMGAAVGATTISFRRWSGGLTINNMATGDVVSVDCVSGGTITVNGTGGTVHVRGMVAVSDGSSGSVTIVQTQALSNTSINAECDTAISDASLATAAAVAALNDISVADVLTTQMTEAYAADGVAPTLAQALFLIQQQLGEFSVSGTTLTVKRLDGTTGAATFTLNDGTSPTAITRAT